MKDHGKTKRTPAYARDPYVLNFLTSHFEGQSSLFWVGTTFLRQTSLTFGTER